MSANRFFDTRRLCLQAITALAILAVVISTLSKSTFDKAPCIWPRFEFQYWIYLGISMGGFLLLAFNDWFPRHWQRRIHHTACALVALLALGGMLAAWYQLTTVTNYAQTLVGNFMAASGLDAVLPRLFGVYAPCRYLREAVLGVTSAQWSLALFALMAALALTGLFKDPVKHLFKGLFKKQLKEKPHHHVPATAGLTTLSRKEQVLAFLSLIHPRGRRRAQAVLDDYDILEEKQAQGNPDNWLSNLYAIQDMDHFFEAVHYLIFASRNPDREDIEEDTEDLCDELNGLAKKHRCTIDWGGDVSNPDFRASLGMDGLLAAAGRSLRTQGWTLWRDVSLAQAQQLDGLEEYRGWMTKSADDEALRALCALLNVRIIRCDF